MRLSACRNEGYNDEIRHLACKTLGHLNMRIKDLVTRLRSAPTPLKAVTLAALLWSVFYYFPVFALRDNYLTRAEDPLSATELFFYLLNIPLATIPIMAVWLWFPRTAERFAKMLRSVSRASVDLPRVNRTWHWPLAAGIAGTSVVVFYLELRADSTTEWFEVSGWIGLSAFLVAFGVQVALTAVTLLRNLHIIVWLRLVIRQGLNLDPLHPDGSGGLGFVGSMIAGMTLFAVSLGAWAVYAIASAYFVRNNSPPISEIPVASMVAWAILIFAYIFLVCGILGYPTLIIHRAMVHERDRLLNNLRERHVDSREDPALVTSERSDRVADAFVLVQEPCDQEDQHLDATSNPFSRRLSWTLPPLSACA